LKVFFIIFIPSPSLPLKVSFLFPDRAVSQVLGVILLVAIVILLAALVFLMIHIPSFDLSGIGKAPSFIEILGVYHENENYDSRVILIHNGTGDLNNSRLWAEFYRNGTKIPAVIGTMNGHDFIATHHNGVQTMGGLGCSGLTWSPGEKIVIDFNDATFHPGDQVRVDIFIRPGNTLVSRYSATA
jgi:flagellin-like protein